MHLVESLLPVFADDIEQLPCHGDSPLDAMQSIDFTTHRFCPLKSWLIRGYGVVTGGLHRVHVVTRGRLVFNKTRDQVQPLKRES
jgi:hypothetical protein